MLTGITHRNGWSSQELHYQVCTCLTALLRDIQADYPQDSSSTQASSVTTRLPTSMYLQGCAEVKFPYQSQHLTTGQAYILENLEARRRLRNRPLPLPPSTTPETFNTFYMSHFSPNSETIKRWGRRYQGI